MGDGKFFCGLTEKMMRKQPNVGPNRQKSNLFWDDDSDQESGADTRRTSRRDPGANVPDTSVNYGSGNRVEPKSSFQKEMTSKIDFFNNDDNYNKNNNKTNNQVKESNTNNYTSQETNRYNACKSNIQFFDYPNDEVVTSRRRTNNTIQMENDKNTFPNSTKTYDKHIKFIENKVSDRSSSPKGILKNKINFISKKDNGNKKINEIILKKNKNKSFENLISRSESAPNLIEDDPIDNVKNIRIEEHDDEIHDKNKIQLESKSKRNFQEDNILLQKHHKNIEQNNSYSKTKHIQNHTITNNPYDMDQYSERSNKLNTKPKLQKGIYRPVTNEKQMTEENLTEVPHSFHTTHEQQEQQPPTANHKIQHPPSQRHLVSNISFCQENTNGHHQQQPTRIRSSAFTRVSVGLPD